MKSCIQFTLRVSRHFSLVCSIPSRSSPARRCASSCVIPCATYSWVFRSRWSRSSSSNSWSARAQRNNDRNRRGILNSQCSGRIFDSPLLVPQGNHGIYTHSAAGGNVASCERNKHEQDRNGDESRGISGLDFEKQAAQEAG